MMYRNAQFSGYPIAYWSIISEHRETMKRRLSADITIFIAVMIAMFVTMFILSAPSAVFGDGRLVVVQKPQTLPTGGGVDRKLADFDWRANAVVSPPPLATLPLSADQRREVKKINAIVYGYSSTKDQTDDSPEITAANTRVRKGIVANNCLRFGTRIRVGAVEMVVEDRMAARYGCNVFDVWYPTRAEAIKHGKQRVEIAVLR